MRKLSATEIITLSLVAIIIFIGYYLFWTSVPAFEIYTEEDGSVEWLTVLGLMMGCVVCIARFIKLRRNRSWWFLTVTLILAFLLFAASGEEISWGQRILGIKSSEFFLENNAQHETNFHNLIVDGVKLNKIIFSIGLVASMAIYLLIFPLLYVRNTKFHRFIDRSGIMIAQNYQIISVILLFGMTEVIRHGKRAEILEAGIALLFFLIIMYPKNKDIYRKDLPQPK